MFWVVKILTTAGGEAVSDHFAVGSRLVGGAFEVGLFLICFAWQFRTRRYVAAAYWSFAYSIAIFGTGVADFMHLGIGIPYIGTTILWAIVLGGVFWVWWKSEGTLSIHSINSTSRELFYWATIFSTFALGTALGDLTATEFGLGYLSSAVVFSVVICIPWLAHWRFRLNGVVAFWAAYVTTRPLGASYADYLDKPVATSGAGLGDGPVAVAFTLAVFLCVAYLAVSRRDIQSPEEQLVPARQAVAGEPEVR